MTLPDRRHHRHLQSVFFRLPTLQLCPQDTLPTAPTTLRPEPASPRGPRGGGPWGLAPSCLAYSPGVYDAELCPLSASRSCQLTAAGDAGKAPRPLEAGHPRPSLRRPLQAAGAPSGHHPGHSPHAVLRGQEEISGEPALPSPGSLLPPTAQAARSPPAAAPIRHPGTASLSTPSCVLAPEPQPSARDTLGAPGAPSPGPDRWAGGVGGTQGGCRAHPRFLGTKRGPRPQNPQQLRALVPP